jgi:hypothetical protein
MCSTGMTLLWQGSIHVVDVAWWPLVYHAGEPAVRLLFVVAMNFVFVERL